MDVKQNFMETLKRGKPEAFVNEWEPFGSVFDPLMGMTLVAQPGKMITDDWGVTFQWKEGEPGAMPYITDEIKAIKDITTWREEIKSPDLAGADLDWTQARTQAEGIHAQGKLTMSLMATGLFEMCHYLMGFEDTLCNLLEEPELMSELIEYITEYKLTYAKLLCENLHPDVILFHDDWGTKDRLFMNAEIWREMYKPGYQKIYDYIKSQGVIIIHHSDSFCEPIVQDMVDVGIDIWQGALPQNDIVRLQQETAGKLIYMGGIDAAIVDRADWNEETVRWETKRACETYGPGGSFIPCLTYGGEGSIFPGVNDTIMDEVRNQSKCFFNAN